MPKPSSGTPGSSAGRRTPVFCPLHNHGAPAGRNVIVNVPGFRGHLDCSLRREDLERFRSQLAHAAEPSNWPCEARLCGAEPGIDVAFRVERTGRVAGAYRFQDSGGEACLSGDFSMDQTYLRPLLRQAEAALRELAERLRGGTRRR